VARNKKILVVEDNNDWRELLVKIINNFGYDVMEARSGRDAIGKTLEMHPDLILMDIYLPDVIGDKIIARLKANPATRDIPVIITTAFPELTVRNHALHPGASEILEKPFSITIIREVLDRYLSIDESN
jgi:CheY-like chemotaxis protein